MKTDTPTPCANCTRLQAQVDALQTKVDALLGEVALLREQLATARKGSSTSSKPPSSDLVKPKPAQPPDGKRTIGGQPGHPKHDREPFPAEQVTRFEEHTLEACPCCGGPLRRNSHFASVVQQVDIAKPPLTVEQHTSPELWCDLCQKPYKAPMPEHIAKGGLLGLELTALIAFMKGACHASFSTIRVFLRDVVGVTISRGQLSKTLDKVSEALDKPYEELLQQLPGEAILHVDETGHKDNGDRWWTWCSRAELYTLYPIDAHRSADVLMDILGKGFQGVIGCDYFSAYRRYLRACSVRLQFCLAHLIGDVKFLTTLPDARDRRYGEDLRLALKDLFEVFHQRDRLDEGTWQARLQAARDTVLRVGLAAPATQHGQNMYKRFAEHGAAYFTFVTTPGVGPTNNLAEQAIRFVVIDRHITQGTRGQGGRRFRERMGTVMATCVQQGQSVYGFLREAVGKWFAGEPVVTPEGFRGPFFKQNSGPKPRQEARWSHHRRAGPVAAGMSRRKLSIRVLSKRTEEGEQKRSQPSGYAWQVDARLAKPGSHPSRRAANRPRERLRKNKVIRASIGPLRPNAAPPAGTG
jgi:transposase